MEQQLHQALVTIEQRVLDVDQAASDRHRGIQNDLARVVANQQVLLEAIKHLDRRLQSLQGGAG